MKFKDLTEEQINKAREIYTDKDLSWDDRMKLLMDLFGKSERTVRKWCSEKLNFKEKVDVEPEQYIKAKARVHDENKKRFIIFFVFYIFFFLALHIEVCWAIDMN